MYSEHKGGNFITIFLQLFNNFFIQKYYNTIRKYYEIKMKKLLIIIYLLMTITQQSFTQDRLNSWGVELLARESEYTISMVIFEITSGRYKLVGPHLNISILLNEKKNNSKIAFSCIGLYSFIPLFIAGFAHPDDLGPKTAKIIGYIAMTPLIIANSQHHFIISKYDSLSLFLPELSVFVQNRTDYYEERWFRLNPGIGLSFSYYTTTHLPEKNNHLFSLSVGIEKPFDIYKWKPEELTPRYFLEVYKFF